MAAAGGRQPRWWFLWAAVLAHVVASGAGFVVDLDESFKENRKDDIWLVDFYAPWCGHCKKLEPVWNEVGIEMERMGSPVKVGKMDATSFSSIASEFGVRGYPTIKLLKGDLAYNYRGPRTKDDIIEFANRVAGALFTTTPAPFTALTAPEDFLSNEVVFRVHGTDDQMVNLSAEADIDKSKRLKASISKLMQTNRSIKA